MSDITIIQAESRKEINAFIDLPWNIYKGYENWVPPLKSAVRKLLDTRRHPFWEFSQRRLFLAKRGTETVGRIAAIVDGNFNERYSLKTGAWGFFECEDNPETASRLFSAAEQWLLSKGMDTAIGPLNPSLNYEVGLLIEGFENRPTIMMTYNPMYYQALIEGCGYNKAMDLISFYFEQIAAIGERVRRLARRFAKRKNLTIRPFDMKKFDEDMLLLRESYNEIWSENWGFVPATEAEAAEVANDFRLIGDPELVFFMYEKDEIAGVCMFMPDINPLLQRLNGKLGLRGLITFLLNRRKMRGIRGMVLGFKKQFRGLGYPLVLVNYVERIGKQRGYKYMELGWNLEGNEAINQFERECGGRFNNRYRIFEKKLPS